MAVKKQFFYAAMALAVMSSYSKNNDPGIGNSEEGDGKAMIALRLDVPTVTANTRGTGSMGDVAGNQNTWSSQKPYIYMMDRSTGLEAEKRAGNAKAKILDNGVLEFRAPKADAKGKSAIRIYKSYTEDSDNGVIQYKYYSTNGQYTFYGYHIDSTASANPGITTTEKKATGVVIGGIQDLLAARTIDMAEDDTSTTDPESFCKDIAISLGGEWTTLMNYQFGAHTVRKDIVPILKSEHQLTRLKFLVRAGSESTAGYGWQANQWVERKSSDAKPKILGMQIAKITLKNMTNVVDMDPTVPSSIRDGAGVADFVVCSKDGAANDKLDPTKGLVVPVAPKCPYGDRSIPESDPNTKGTRIGEPVIFFPIDGTNNEGDTTSSVNLRQYVEDTKDEATGTITYKEVGKVDNKLTIEQSKISGAAQEFMPGVSYNVYVTIYGFEKIEVTAILIAWESGGNIDASIEDDK